MARKQTQKPSDPEDIQDEVLTKPADVIDPYEVLAIQNTATSEEIKSAYRKAALKHHPDKAKPDQKDEAKQKFQEIATAYAILSDEKRRRRFDATGNTSESLEDDNFNWTEFFREQSAAMVDGAMIEQIKKEYQGSEEEREDVLGAYKEGKGNMDLVYELVMCSNVLEDDQRFRDYIDEAINSGSVARYPKYSKESQATKRKRVKRAKDEEHEAMALAEELGVGEKLFGKRSKNKHTEKVDGDALKALIQQRQKHRSEDFFDQLETKYGGGRKTKRKADDQPPEELFQKNAKKTKAKG